MSTGETFKCWSCHQADVLEPGDYCADCKRRMEHPAAGDGCSILIGSDTYPATVLRVTPHTIVVGWDKEHRGGLTTPGVGKEMRFFKDKGGHWGHRSYQLVLGARASHRDPSF